MVIHFYFVCTNAAELETKIEFCQTSLDEAGIKAALNYASSVGARPLHCAVGMDHDLCSAILLEAGADVNLPMANGATPLYFACLEGK